MSQLKKGALLSYLTIFLTTIIGLVLTPFIIKSLGDAEYGLYILIGGVIGYISILDLGLNNAIIRYVSKYRAENDKTGEENFLATTMVMYGIISIVVVLIGVLLYFNLENIFGNSLTVYELDKAKIMFQILIFNLAITLPGGAFTAICNAYENFVFPRALNIVKYVSRSLLIYFVLLYGGDAIAMVWIDTILNILIFCITACYVFLNLKVSIKFRSRLNFLLVKDIFSYSIWIFIFAIVIQLQWNTGQVILGITTNTETVAVFGLGSVLAGYYGAFASALNSLLLPRATKMSVNKLSNSKKYTDEMIRVGRLNLYVLFFILSGFFLFGKSFIFIWVGESYLHSWFVAVIIMIALTLQLIQSFGNIILEALKKTRFKSLLTLSTILIGLIIGFYFSKKYSINGVVIPLGIAVLLNSIIMTYYFKKIFGLEVKRFLNSVFSKPLIFISLLTVITYLLLLDIAIDNWISLVLSIFIYSIIYMVIIYFLMNKEERNFLKFKMK